MDPNRDKVLYRDESDQIVGAAMEVLNELGPGLVEKPDENTLVVECQLRQIPYSQQSRYPVLHKGVKVHEQVVDLIAFGKIVVDPK